MSRYRIVGVLELIASTAAANRPSRVAFWADRMLRRQFYSVMPQAVCVWARQLGCEVRYATYFGQHAPQRLLGRDLDLVFIVAPSQQSALAYALCRYHRSQGARVVLAGPHARAYPADARRFADIVVTTADRLLVEAVVRGEIEPGCIVRSARPLRELPLVEEREQEIRTAAYAGERRLRISTVATVSSLGCPYTCDFCSEWDTAYVGPRVEHLSRDLAFIAERFPNALIGFHDPNFGVRFDETLSAFEVVEPGRRNPFVMECTLSILNASRLARLREVNCQLIAPGIESWGDYSDKTGTRRRSGRAKLESISARIRDISRFVPALQTNIILGVDADVGPEPFELTAEFIREHPGVWANVNIPYPFGGTPLADRVCREERLVEALPYMFYTAPYPAMHPLHYPVTEYLRRMVGIYRLLVSARRLAGSLRRIDGWLHRAVWTARIVALRAELAELQAFVSALHSSPDLRAFIDNRTRRLPAFFA
ncbi:MAG: radical SAM protein, partial [Gammaproteobacteria bacterium]|nr:radical SAM protein [Gammaproteobacteria bacterium]